MLKYQYLTWVFLNINEALLFRALLYFDCNIQVMTKMQL